MVADTSMSELEIAIAEFAIAALELLGAIFDLDFNQGRKSQEIAARVAVTAQLKARIGQIARTSLLGTTAVPEGKPFRGHIAEFAAADVVVTKDGKVLKSKFGDINVLVVDGEEA